MKSFGHECAISRDMKATMSCGKFSNSLDRLSGTKGKMKVGKTERDVENVHYILCDRSVAIIQLFFINAKICCGFYEYVNPVFTFELL